MMALIWVKELYPRISGLIERIPRKVGEPVTWMLTAFLVLDISLTASALIRFGERQENIEAEGNMDQFLDEHFPDSLMLDRYSNIKLRVRSASGEVINSWKSPLK